MFNTPPLQVALCSKLSHHVYIPVAKAINSSIRVMYFKNWIFLVLAKAYFNGVTPSYLTTADTNQTSALVMGIYVIYLLTADQNGHLPYIFTILWIRECDIQHIFHIIYILL